jgi:hypothetical protein
MGRTRIVEMRFDLTNEYHAATYQRLAESAQRAGRRGRGIQANYLSSLMLGVRPSNCFQYSGLIERPDFPPTIKELEQRLVAIEASFKKVASDVGNRSSKKNHAPRLVPPSDQSCPEQSA